MSVVTNRLEEGNDDQLGQVVAQLEDPEDEVHGMKEREARLANGLLNCCGRRRHVP